MCGDTALRFSIMPGLTKSETNRLLDDLAKQGAVVQPRSKSVWRVRFPDGTVIVAHSSPSDVNWHRHLKRATEKAGLHWPLEDRATMKKIIKEKEGRGGMTQFVMSYGEHVKDYIGIESRDKVAQFLTGKRRTTSPQIQAGTGLSQPTVTRSLIALGWLQEAEKEKEIFVDAQGQNKAKMNTYWSPAPESVLSQVTFHATAKTPRAKRSGDEPKVTAAAKTARPTPEDVLNGLRATRRKVEEAAVEVAAEIEQLRGGPVDLAEVLPDQVEQAAEAIAETMAEPEPRTFTPDPDGSLPGFDAPSDPDQKDWFEEAAAQEQRAVTAESRVTDLEQKMSDAAAQILDLSRQLSEARAEDSSWAAPGIDQLPDGTTVADLFSTLRLMGLAPEIRLRRGDAA